jgi:hypothetical protein
MKATNRYRESSQYLPQKFPQMSEAKMKVEIFIGPHINELVKYGNHDYLQERTKTSALKEIKLTVVNFLGYYRSLNNK